MTDRPDEFDEFDDDDGPPFGQSGALCNPDIHIKWIVDGAPSLGAAAAGLRAYADHVDRLASSGWELDQPIDNSHGYVVWRGEGDPPPADCNIVDCAEHQRT